MNKRAFTLIELLVVVLIIGILSAIALPQYQKAVERARMVEAITILRAIAQAHQVYYLANGTYLSSSQMDLLDIDIPDLQLVPGRRTTKYFIYSPAAQSGQGSDLAYARRYDTSFDDSLYVMRITIAEPDKVSCSLANGTNQATKIQKQLCQQLNNLGYL